MLSQAPSPVPCPQETLRASVHGISQARILEWVAISSSRGSPPPGTEPVSPALQIDYLPSEATIIIQLIS